MNVLRKTFGVALMLTIVAMLLVSGCTSKAQSGRGVGATPSVTKVSATLVDEPAEDMYRNSTAVVLARVEKKIGPFRVDSPSGDDRSPGATQQWVYTEWSVVPLKVYKSDGVVAKGRPLDVALRGGTLGDSTTEYDAEAEFADGEKVLLFLTKDDDPAAVAPGRYFTYAAFLGKYRIDDATGMAISRNNRKTVKLSSLEAKLK